MRRLAASRYLRRHLDAAAMILRPKLVVLDEPTSALDMAAVRQ